MNSPSCTIPSRLRAFIAAGPVALSRLRPVAGLGHVACLAAAILMIGCGGSRPEAVDRDRPELPMANESQAGEKGEGTISFHYANKSTDANLAIDLGSTDVYLEMTGSAAAAMGAEMAQADRGGQKAPAERATGEKRAAAAPGPAAAESGEDPQAEREGDAKPEVRKPGKPRPEKEKYDPARLSEEPERADNEDVTAKVMSGIRRAQDLFYQKRYPEALLAVRSSLDARPTAEGHALAGSIHYMKGESGMARRQWMEALRLNPDMPAVVNMLERTRTPGGRGSPAPRPIQTRPLAAPQAEVVPDDRVPFPEEYRPEDVPLQPRPVPANAGTPSAPSPAPRDATPVPAEPVPATVPAAPTTVPTAPAKTPKSPAP